ncbi:proline racemase family protein [Halarcobacter anaerophilus]|uniref:Proline racemase n=1 Tax=Halarcobacter anaerophilus TaxID=877500 RepID=A0A4Q0Y396_9BACT|nr:proline racemase family protein [Halarcobacter anaerophilus]QDF29086.1 proline racemase [Halarcobacter anaerophilus]RXJ63714.1 proline racemase [Halarcobacter anaerophilus]
MAILNNLKIDNKKFLKLKTIDMHTEGEPLRVILEGYPEIKGKTILEKRNYFKENLDYIRTSLMYEPRGHADMYGVVIVEADNKDSDFGVIFMHNEGYSTMCGHATIAITKLAVELGWIQIKKPITTLKIDAPCGQIESFIQVDSKGKILNICFKCVPSFVIALNETIKVQNIGEVSYDLAYGGAFYAYVNADLIELSLDKQNYDKIISYGKKIKKAIIEKKNNIKHPFEEDLSFLYGVIFITKSDKYHSKNVCVFANGEVDRSPTGSGVSGRTAIEYLRKNISIGEEITIESILGTTFNVKVDEEIKYGNFDAVVPKVTGTAYITGEHTFLIDKKDPLKYGFFLR